MKTKIKTVKCTRSPFGFNPRIEDGNFVYDKNVNIPEPGDIVKVYSSYVGLIDKIKGTECYYSVIVDLKTNEKFTPESHPNDAILWDYADLDIYEIPSEEELQKFNKILKL